jgi:multiple sugar transport system ATP-binding protein
VARFIGAPSMSILTTHLAGRAIAHTASTGFSMPERWEPSSQIGDSVLLGFRPEDVRLVGQNSFEKAAHFKGRVEMVETLGHEVLTHLDVDGATLIAKSQGEAPIPRLGEMVEVEADLSKAHFFDVSTNLRLTEKA